MTQELKALTSVRGIAAWLVVLYHIRLSIAGLPEWALAVLDKGYLAVDFFFLLSGFVIWLSWHERVRAQGFGVVPTFLKKRVARIWPLHLFVLTAAVALAVLLAATGRHDAREFPFGELPLHILLLQNWGFTNALSWNDPAWSISAEMGAYLVFPVLVLAVDWRRVPAWAVVAAIGGLFVLLAAMLQAQGAADLGADIARFGLVRCVLEFAAGTGLCALWLRWKDKPRVPAILSGVAALACFDAFLVGVYEPLSIPAAFAAALLALALTAGRAGHPLEGRAVHWLGQISYATYLGHFLLWVTFKLAFVSDADAVPVHLVMLYLAMVLAISAALYRWVERPAQRWVNGLRLPHGIGGRPARQAAPDR